MSPKKPKCLDTWLLLQESPDKVHIAKFEDDLAECVLEARPHMILILIMETSESETMHFFDYVESAILN